MRPDGTSDAVGGFLAAIVLAAVAINASCAPEEPDHDTEAVRTAVELLELERAAQESGSPAADAVGGGAAGGDGRPAPRAAVEAVQALTDAQLLSILAGTGRLARDPWAKLFHEPPLTGPRPGVDTTRYVAFARGMAERTVVRYDPERPDLPPVHFEDWPADSQAAFLAREWRCLAFNQCGRAGDPCVCENQAWTVRKEIP